MSRRQVQLTRLRAERLLRGLSQQTLAVNADMGVSDVSRIETGRMKPYSGQAERLARVLGLLPDELLQPVELVAEPIAGVPASS